MSDDDPYIYPGTSVLRNKLDIRDPDTLQRQERRLVTDRIIEGAPRGDFDLVHLRAIHRHLFQDLYDWAGEIRTVEISKGGNHFQFRQYIETGMADVHRRLVAEDYFHARDAAAFAQGAAAIVGDINYAHPFRESNGRAQLQYLKLLGERAGHPIDLSRLRRDAWIDASKEAHLARYGGMEECIEDALISARRRRTE
jgi:cell filamentation protein